MQFLALLSQYLPLIFGLAQVAENATANIAGKTGPQKQAAVISGLVAAAPAIGQMIQANPDHSNHLKDYINGTVALMNSLNQSFPPPVADVQQAAAASA